MRHARKFGSMRKEQVVSLTDKPGEIANPRRGDAQRHALLGIALLASVRGAESCVDFAEFRYIFIDGR
jgi:hypothetical protein